MIRFIIKSVFWLSLAFIVMPKIINSDTDHAQREHAKIALPPQEKIDEIITASQTAAEVGGFCFNNPALCIEGKNILSAAGSGLLAGSGQLLDFLSGHFASKEAKDTPSHIDGAQDAAQNNPHAIPLPNNRPQ